MSQIKFGTDGWRAIIDEDFIPENIGKVIQAFADVYPTLPEAGKPVVIGYDRRLKSPETAKQIAEILLGNGIETVLSATYCPTPTVAWYVKKNGCAAGIMVTASHNPPQWNGIKFKESYGGAASAEYLAPIEAHIVQNDANGREVQYASIEGNPLFSTFDPYGEYLTAVTEFIDTDRIKKAGFQIVVDPLYGAGTGYFPKLLGPAVTEIHTESDTNFGGLHPEPIPPYIDELSQVVASKRTDGGLVTDGDADRLGAVDEHGTYITTHEIYSLLILHALTNKKWSGKIIKSISTTMMVNRIGKKYDTEVETTPVGFKYISPAMKAPGVLVGGEESGGYGFPRHIPERDGIFSGLMLLELMAASGKTLSQLVGDLQEEFGPCRYRRIDLKLSADEIARAREAMAALDIKAIGDLKVVHHETMDGHHFRFEDDSWLLFRASGTEPLVRIYAEAPSTDQVETMLMEGKRAIGVD